MDRRIYIISTTVPDSDKAAKLLRDNGYVDGKDLFITDAADYNNVEQKIKDAVEANHIRYQHGRDGMEPLYTWEKTISASSGSHHYDQHWGHMYFSASQNIEKVKMQGTIDEYNKDKEEYGRGLREVDREFSEPAKKTDFTPVPLPVYSMGINNIPSYEEIHPQKNIVNTAERVTGIEDIAHDSNIDISNATYRDFVDKGPIEKAAYGVINISDCIDELEKQGKLIKCIDANHEKLKLLGIDKNKYPVCQKQETEELKLDSDTHITEYFYGDEFSAMYTDLRYETSNKSYNYYGKVEDEIYQYRKEHNIELPEKYSKRQRGYWNDNKFDPVEMRNKTNDCLCHLMDSNSNDFRFIHGNNCYYVTLDTKIEDIVTEEIHGIACKDNEFGEYFITDEGDVFSVKNDICIDMPDYLHGNIIYKGKENDGQIFSLYNSKSNVTNVYKTFCKRTNLLLQEDGNIQYKLETPPDKPSWNQTEFYIADAAHENIYRIEYNKIREAKDEYIAAMKKARQKEINIKAYDQYLKELPTKLRNMEQQKSFVYDCHDSFDYESDEREFHEKIQDVLRANGWENLRTGKKNTYIKIEDHPKKHMEVFVENDTVGLCIGSKGKNIKKAMENLTEEYPQYKDVTFHFKETGKKLNEDIDETVKENTDKLNEQEKNQEQQWNSDKVENEHSHGWGSTQNIEWGTVNSGRNDDHLE